MASGVYAGQPSQPPPGAAIMNPQMMQQQQMHSQQQQQPFKGTLAPGTRVQVGAITVTVKRYLSEGQ